MKTKISLITLSTVLFGSLAYLVYIYFGGYKFEPATSEFTINLKKREYQPIFLDNLKGTSRLVLLKATKISDPDSVGIAVIEEMYAKLIKVSGIGSPELKEAKFDGSTVEICFARGDTCKEVKVELPTGGIKFDTNVSAPIRTIRVDNLKITNSNHLNSPCQELFNEQGFIGDLSNISEGCLDFLNEEGRICNGNCVHE